MKISQSIIAVLATACLAASAQAQLDSPVFTAGPDTTTRFNVNAISTTYPTGRPDAIAYAPVYVTSNGGSHLRVNQASVGIRRVGSATTPAVAVTVEVTIQEMTFDGTNYGLGNVVQTFTQELSASTTSLTQVVSKSWGDSDPAVRPVVNLQTITNGANGYAGFWVGVRFIGAGSSSSANGWRVVTEPVLGRSNNNFGINDPTNTGWGANFNFGTIVGTDGVTRENQARFSVNVNGLVTDSVTPPPTLVYGNVFETGTYWKPTDALDGVGSKRFYNSAFVRANPGDALTPSKVSMDIYRGGTTVTPAPAIGVELALVKMTWDVVASTYGVGDVVATQTFQLAASETAKTDRIDWIWSNPATAPVVALNTNNPANVNLGGLWVAARFLGDSDALLGNNGPITGFAPAYGASLNSFAMDNDGVLTTYTFSPAYTWTPAATGVITFYDRPSRFMLEAFGVVGPNVPPLDTDSDGIPDGADNCPVIANTTQADCNNNGVGDACEIADGAPDCNTNTIPDSCELAAGTALDCNANGVPDSCDIASGLSHDVDSNGIPDECKADCNGNGLPDAWEISQGTATDCNLNAIPDACENDSGTISTGNMGAFGAGVAAVGALTGCVPSTTPVSLRLDLIGDLNATTEYATLKLGGVTVGSLLFQATGHDCPTTPDSVMISITAAQWNSLLASTATSGVIAVEVLGSPLVSATQCAKSLSVLTAQYGGPRYDCDSNGVSDLCQIAAGAVDCNHNARLDACEIQDGTVTDVDQNGTIDSCQVDCNTNQLPDSWEISQGTVPDCNASGVPDSCDIATNTVPDCNTNGVPDSCDIASGASNDVDSNGIPDECKTDCNGNGLPDAWEISQGTVSDCNLNSIPDSCDLTSGAAADCNVNGVPDSCDITNGAIDKDANGQPDDCQFAYGDFDLSGDIGGADLGFLLAVWGTNSVVGDLDGDHGIGGGDLAVLLSRWGPVQ